MYQVNHTRYLKFAYAEYASGILTFDSRENELEGCGVYPSEERLSPCRS
jgi:hypothetical protein